MIRNILLKSSKNFELDKENKLNELNSILKKSNVSNNVLFNLIINTRYIWDEVDSKVKGRLISSLNNIFNNENLIQINEFLGNFEIKYCNILKFTIAKDLYDIIQPYYPMFQVIGDVLYKYKITSSFNDDETIEILEYYNEYTYGYENDIPKLLNNNLIFLKYLFNRKDKRLNLSNENNIVDRIYLSYKNDFKSFEEFKTLYTSNDELNFSNSFNFSRLNFKDFLDNIFFFINYTCQFSNTVDLKEIDFNEISFEYIKEYFKNDKNDIINLFLTKEEGFNLFANIFIRMINHYNEYNVIGLLDCLNENSIRLIRNYLDKNIIFDNDKDLCDLNVSEDYEVNIKTLFACISFINYSIKNNKSFIRFYKEAYTFKNSIFKLFTDLEAISGSRLKYYYRYKGFKFKDLFIVNGYNELKTIGLTNNIIRSLFFKYNQSITLQKEIIGLFSDNIFNLNVNKTYNLDVKMSLKFFIFFKNMIDFYVQNEINYYNVDYIIKDIEEYGFLDLESLKFKFNQNITSIYFYDFQCIKILSLDIINSNNYTTEDIITIYSMFRDGIKSLTPKIFKKYFKYIYNDKHLLQSALVEYDCNIDSIDKITDFYKLKFISNTLFKSFISSLKLNYVEYTNFIETILDIINTYLSNVSISGIKHCYRANFYSLYENYDNVHSISISKSYFKNIECLFSYINSLSSNFKLINGTVIKNINAVINNSYLLKIVLKMSYENKELFRPFVIENFNINTYDKSKLINVLNLLKEYINFISNIYVYGYIEPWMINLKKSTNQEIEKYFFKIGNNSLSSVENSRNLKIKMFENYQYPNNKLFKETLDTLVMLKGNDKCFISKFFYDLFEIYLNQNEFYYGKRKKNVSLYDSELFLLYSTYLKPEDLYFIINKGYFSKIPKGSNSFNEYIDTGKFNSYFDRKYLSFSLNKTSNITLFEEAIIRNIIFNMNEYKNIDYIYDIEKKCKEKLDIEGEYPDYTKFIKRVIYNKMEDIRNNILKRLYYNDNNNNSIFVYNSLSNFLDEKIPLHCSLVDLKNRINENLFKNFQDKDLEKFFKKIENNLSFDYDSNLNYDVREYSLENSNIYTYRSNYTLNYLNYPSFNFINYVKDNINGNLIKPINNNTFIIKTYTYELRTYLDFKIIFNNVSDKIFELCNNEELLKKLRKIIVNYIKNIIKNDNDIELISDDYNKFLVLLEDLFKDYIDDDTVISFI